MRTHERFLAAHRSQRFDHRSPGAPGGHVRNARGTIVSGRPPTGKTDGIPCAEVRRRRASRKPGAGGSSPRKGLTLTPASSSRCPRIRLSTVATSLHGRRGCCPRWSAGYRPSSAPGPRNSPAVFARCSLVPITNRGRAGGCATVGLMSEPGPRLLELKMLLRDVHPMVLVPGLTLKKAGGAARKVENPFGARTAGPSLAGQATRLRNRRHPPPARRLDAGPFSGRNP